MHWLVLLQPKPGQVGTLNQLFRRFNFAIRSYLAQAVFLVRQCYMFRYLNEAQSQHWIISSPAQQLDSRFCCLA